jgi:hypothetical protein
VGTRAQPKRLIQILNDQGTGLRTIRLQDTETLEPLPESLLEAGVDGSRLTMEYGHVIKVSEHGDLGDGTTAALFIDCVEDVLDIGASDAVMALELQSVRVGSVCSSDGLVLRRPVAEDGVPQTSEDDVPVYVRLGKYEFQTEVHESKLVRMWGISSGKTKRKSSGCLGTSSYPSLRSGEEGLREILQGRHSDSSCL